MEQLLARILAALREDAEYRTECRRESLTDAVRIAEDNVTGAGESESAARATEQRHTSAKRRAELAEAMEVARKHRTQLQKKTAELTAYTGEPMPTEDDALRWLEKQVERLEDENV